MPLLSTFYTLYGLDLASLGLFSDIQKPGTAQISSPSKYQPLVQPKCFDQKEDCLYETFLFLK